MGSAAKQAQVTTCTPAAKTVQTEEWNPTSPKMSCASPRVALTTVDSHANAHQRSARIDPARGIHADWNSPQGEAGTDPSGRSARGRLARRVTAASQPRATYNMQPTYNAHYAAIALWRTYLVR
jgi:hypothetical protein